jgi:integrase
MRKTKGLYKRGNVYWMCYKLEGTVYRSSTGKTTQKEAEYVLACRRKDIEDGNVLNVNKGKCKFAQLAKEYDTILAQKQKGYGSKKYIIRQLVEEFGNLYVKDLDTMLVERYQGKYLRTRKPATANRMLACLKHMLTKAVDWNMANEETLKRVRKVKFLKENNIRLRFLNVDECKRLIECCPKHLKPIVTTAVNTGMRRGEILSLKWKQIDLRHGYISLTDTKSGEGREVPINNTLGEMFVEMPHSIESTYVFTNKDGDPYKEIKRSFSTALRKAEIYGFRFHDLRHTFASQLVMKGVDLTTVKELLGHKSIIMTMRYAHLAPEHKTKAVRVLDEVLKSSTNENFSSQSGSQFTDCSNLDCRNSLPVMVGATGFEPATS